MKYRGVLRFIKLGSFSTGWDPYEDNIPDKVVIAINGRFSTLPEDGGTVHFVSPELASPTAAALDGDGLIILDNIDMKWIVSGPIDKLDHAKYVFKSNEQTYVLEITHIELDPELEEYVDIGKLPNDGGCL